MILSPPKLLTKVIQDIQRNKQHRLLISSSFFLCPLMFAKKTKKSSKQVTFEVQHVATKLSATHLQLFWFPSSPSSWNCHPFRNSQGQTLSHPRHGGYIGWGVTRCDEVSIRGPCNNRDNKTSRWHRNQHRPNTLRPKVPRFTNLQPSMEILLCFSLPNFLQNHKKCVQWKTLYTEMLQHLK